MFRRVSDVDPCVFLSAHVGDWAGAFGRAAVEVARRMRMSLEELVSYVAYSPPQAATVASLLCKLANFGRVCQYAAAARRLPCLKGGHNCGQGDIHGADRRQRRCADGDSQRRC